MHKVDTLSRLTALRQLMRDRQVDVYVVPSEDSHQSEYIAPCDARREYISGFSGSAGCAVVTTDKAVLATDGRYFNQAAQQLDGNWLLLKQGMPGVPLWQDWAAEQSAGGKVVGVDPTLIPASEASKLSARIKTSGGSGLRAVDENLVDIVWGTSRPPRPSHPVEVRPQQFAGSSVREKLEKVRETLVKRKSPALAVSTLDDIAWLFNLRGSDIPYNPVFFAYAVVTESTATLYIDESKLAGACRRHLAENNVHTRPYDSIFDDARMLSQATLPAGAVVESSGSNSAAAAAAATATATATVLDDNSSKVESGDDGNNKNNQFTISNKTSLALQLALGGSEATSAVRSIIGDLKAIKNQTELAGMRACNVRDGAALVEYFAWLEDQLLNKSSVLDEVAAADKLESIRAKQEHFVGLSFSTVSATGANAAVIHYEPQRDSCSIIDPNSIYLCDSGAQYLDGTTDTTRTIHHGTPTAAERRAYTLVLKGHIALDTAVFPKGTSGFVLDCLARQFLRRDGLDYRHSTGHGVGSYLNVHEGPIGIGLRPEFIEVALQPGHVLSNEPGYYEDGAFGIRIENVMAVVEADTPNRFGGEPFLGFENITMVPLCRNLIQPDLLSDLDKQWINNYHAKVLNTLEGFFEADPLTRAWLARETRPLLF